MTFHARPHTISRFLRPRTAAVLAALAALAATLGAPALAAPIEWALFDRSCARGTSTLEVPCGAVGVYHFVHVVAPSGCQPLASGNETPALYPIPGVVRAFPADPDIIGGEVGPVGFAGSGGGTGDPGELSMYAAFTPEELGAFFGESSTADASIALPGPDLGDDGGGEGAVSSGTSMAIVHAPAPQPQPLPPPAWAAVIDFDGAHGASTSWLVGRLTMDSATTTLTILDDPLLDPLGDVGDFHVLAQLCSIAERAQTSGTVPRVVNMSFGRGLLSGDPQSGTGCAAGTVACQIAKVIDQLHDEGATLVASSGNQQEPLYPGSLAHVLSIGMLDVNALLATGQSRPAWETPAAAVGVFPGNGLCLRGWSAPAGSSYSSALFAGWLASLLTVEPDLDPMAGGAWTPVWDPRLACYVLARDGQAFSRCNAKASEIIEGLAGANEVACWTNHTGPTEVVGGGGRAVPQPGIPSFTSWSVETHATPESDPCVPCVAKLVPQDLDLTINLSEASLLPEGTFIDSVYLRADDQFIPLSLSPEQLQGMEAGTLGELVLESAAPLVAPGSSLSLWYEMKNTPFADCNLPDACFWSSTPIILGDD